MIMKKEIEDILFYINFYYPLKRYNHDIEYLNSRIIIIISSNQSVPSFHYSLLGKPSIMEIIALIVNLHPLNFNGTLLLVIISSAFNLKKVCKCTRMSHNNPQFNHIAT